MGCLRVGRHEGLQRGRAWTVVNDDPQDVRVAIEQLRTAVERRPVIDHARGVLMAAHRLTSEDAWKVLVSVSQHSNIKLRTVAVDIVANAPGGDVNGSYPRLIENALAKLKAE